MQLKQQIKIGLSLVFIILISFQLGLKSYMSVWYLLDNASFEKEYCVNIDLPDKMCHGSCAIEGFATNTNDDKNPINIQLSKWVEFIIPNVVIHTDNFLVESIICSPFRDISFLYSSPYLDGFLHPPSYLYFSCWNCNA